MPFHTSMLDMFGFQQSSHRGLYGDIIAPRQELQKEKIIKIKEKTMKILQNTLMTLFFSTQVLGAELPIGEWKNFALNLLENNHQELPADLIDLNQHFHFLDRHLNLRVPLNPITRLMASQALIGMNVLHHPQIIDNINTLSEEEFQELLHDVIIEQYQAF